MGSEEPITCIGFGFLVYRILGELTGFALIIAYSCAYAPRNSNTTGSYVEDRRGLSATNIVACLLNLAG